MLCGYVLHKGLHARPAVACSTAALQSAAARCGLLPRCRAGAADTEGGSAQGSGNAALPQAASRSIRFRAASTLSLSFAICKSRRVINPSTCKTTQGSGQTPNSYTAHMDTRVAHYYYTVNVWN